ncbi:DNA primase [Sediminibacterium soli]|uniref:DNA primase n=1 Tax=Sediminibacterium soli TaxID=2698829 RepID=UPI00137A810E|nr:DNA primase [Sediminibacterium soli]NCI46071.1 DNA primase [Sediminibacterium soli]
MISPNTIQQITNRIDIIDVVGEFVKLKKRGTNYLGLCPFHNEKTPSFTVSPAKEIYKCFGCGKSGNTIGFVMEHEKCSYVEALRWLAARYNIEVEETETSPEQKLQQQTADSLYAINHFAQRFFSEQLFEGSEGQTIAMSYLKERGFRNEVLQKFQVGYNPEARDTLTRALLTNQFSREVLPKTGLVSVRNEELVDNYRGRIIFPIHGITGKIIGFGARVIGKSDRGPKYINTPENEIYTKSKILYGAYFARMAIDKADECLLVEGYTDVVSLHQAGIENVVASGGTSLTTDQLRLIKKYTNNLTIIYDGDSAGVKAALRGLDMALEESLNVRLVLIPDNEDPDSYVNKVGTRAFNEFVAASKKDFIIFQLEVMLKEAGNDVTKKSDVVNQVAETLSKISRAEDFTKQQDYIRQCSSLLRIDESGLTNLVNKYKRDRITKEEKRAAGQEQAALPPQEFQGQPEDVLDETQLLLQQDEAHERNLLRVLLDYGLRDWDDTQKMADHIFEELQDFHFENQQLEKLFEEYRSWYQRGLEPTTRTLLYHEDEQIRQAVVNISVVPFELSQNWDEVMEMKIVGVDNSRQDVSSSVNFFKLQKIKKLIEQNQRDMEHASYDDFKMLHEVHNHLKQLETSITNQMHTVIIK